MTDFASKIQPKRRVSSAVEDIERNLLISQWQNTQVQMLLREIIDLFEDEIVDPIITLELANQIDGYKSIPGEGNTIWMDWIGEKIDAQRASSEDRRDLLAFRGATGTNFNAGRFASVIPELVSRLPVSDEQYEIILKMGIKRNLGNGTVPDISSVIKLAYPEAIVEDKGDLSVVVHINTPNTDKFAQYQDSNVLVKPAGVNVKYTKTGLMGSTADTTYDINIGTAVTEELDHPTYSISGGAKSITTLRNDVYVLNNNGTTIHKLDGNTWDGQSYTLSGINGITSSGTNLYSIDNTGLISEVMETRSTPNPAPNTSGIQSIAWMDSDEIYGVNPSSNMLYKIVFTTNAISSIGTISGVASESINAIENVAGTIYGIGSDGNLFTINKSNATATKIGDTQRNDFTGLTTYRKFFT